MNFSTILAALTAAMGAITPALDIADPAVGTILTTLSKILAGVAAAEPNAVALINQIKSGAPVTEADMQAAIAAYDAADDKLSADISAKLGE